MKIKLANGQELVTPKMSEDLLNQMFGAGNYSILEVSASNKLDSLEKLKRLGIDSDPELIAIYKKGLALHEEAEKEWAKLDICYKGTKRQVGRGFYFQNPDKVPANIKEEEIE